MITVMVIGHIRTTIIYNSAIKHDNNYTTACSKMSIAYHPSLTLYNYQQLLSVGVVEKYEDIDKYMWHGGAHHVGWNTHDEVSTVDVLKPGMVFCVDVGIYHESWGIGFRLEDNCLITEEGCENLSVAIPRTIQEIEDFMQIQKS